MIDWAERLQPGSQLPLFLRSLRKYPPTSSLTTNLAVKNLLCCGHQCRSGQWWLLSSDSLFYKENAGGGLEKPCLRASYGECFIPRLTHFTGSSAPFPLLCLPPGRGTQLAAAGAGTMPRGGGATASWERERRVLGSICLVMGLSSFSSAISKCYWTVPFPPAIPFKILWMHLKMLDFWNTLYLLMDFENSKKLLIIICGARTSPESTFWIWTAPALETSARQP